MRQKLPSSTPGGRLVAVALAIAGILAVWDPLPVPEKALARLQPALAKAPPQVKVVATLYPLAFAAREVAAPGVEVSLLTPVGAEPHDFELTAAELADLREADLVVYLAGFQPAVDGALEEGHRPSLDVLHLPGVVPVELRSPAGELGEAPRSWDPHFWLDPQRLAQVASAIAERVGSPARLAEFQKKLQVLDQELERGLAGCRRREVLSAHAAFAYLCQRYRLVPLSAAGVDPESELLPRDLQRALAMARSAGVRTVFSETLVPSPTLQALARELGARIAVLNPVEGLRPEEEQRGEDYFSVMRQNLAALREGLECKP